MPRRFIALTSLAAGTAIAVATAVATPALAKGATQASITGPGLARPVTLSAQGEALPGEGDTLSSLAEKTGLFTVLFGPGSGTPDQPSPLRMPPAATSLGPKYTLTYTVPGVTPKPGQPAGQIRQYLYPRAAGGTLIYTLPGQQGFGQPLQATGWLRGTPQLTATLMRLGVPADASLPFTPGSAASVSATPAPKPGDTTAPAWLIAIIVSAVVIAIPGTAWWLRRRFRPASDRPATGQPATEETSGQPQHAPAIRPERNALAVSDRRPGDAPQVTAARPDPPCANCARHRRYRQVNRTGGPRRERDRDRLASLTGDDQGAVAPFQAQVLNVRAGTSQRLTLPGTYACGRCDTLRAPP